MKTRKILTILISFILMAALSCGAAAEYTVDFTYSEYTFSIAGESTITLAALFQRLGIVASPEDIVDVAFTDESLIRVEQSENGWQLVSLKPFNTDETLTAYMADGTAFVIGVTDAQNVTVTGTLQGTTMKSLGYNVYAYLVSQNGNGEAYGVKINFVDGNFSGTINNVPEGEYKLVLAYKANNQQLQEGKWNKNNVEECITVDTDGQYLFGYTAQMPDGNIAVSADNHAVSFAMEVSPVQTNISLDTIMDRAINYGIVADDIKYNVRAYTNFATKHIDISNSNDSTIYSHRADGIDVVPNIIADIDHNGQPMSTQDKDANYYVTDEDQGKVSSKNSEETIVRNKNELEDRVEIMISNTLKQAEQLADQSSVILPAGLISVDVSPYGENATIVLDATAISGEQNGFTIVKRPGQTVVFNINGQNAAPPQNTKIKLVDENGNQIGNTYVAGDQMRNAPASDGDIWNKIIWNFPDATSVTATNQIGGIFLVPKGDFTAANKGGGWIVARGKVTVTNEWYGFPGSDEPFKQKIIRKTFVGIEGKNIDPDYAVKLWTHTNESTAGTTQDQLITTLVTKPSTDTSLTKDPSGVNDQTGYLNTGIDADGNVYYEWKTPSISVGNEHKLTEINSASKGDDKLDLIEFIAPFSGWNEAAKDYIWWQKEELFTSEAEFAGIFNVSSHNEDYRQYVYITNNYNVEKNPHDLTLQKVVVDPEGLEAENREYTFVFTLKDEKGNPISDQSISYSINNGETQTMMSQGGALSINLKKGGMVKLLGLPYGTQYTITESDIPLKCEVAFSGDTSDSTKATGKLIKDRSVTATNTYSDDPGVPITAHKDLIDGVLEAKQFTFRLVNSAGKTVATATNDANGNIAFPTLVFDADGEYDYRLYEVFDMGMKDVIFDTHAYNVHIVVQGGRARQVTYDGTDTTPMFRNRKISLNSDTLTARKIFVDADGKAVELSGGEFTFTATGDDGTKYTGTNNADGMVTFRDASGNVVDLNTLSKTTVFTIAETNGSYSGTVAESETLRYDNHSYSATATVEEQTITVTPWTTTVISEDITELTVTFKPKDTSGYTYYCRAPYNNVNYSNIRSDETVTFTFSIQAVQIGANKKMEYSFDYGKDSPYSGEGPIGTVYIIASASSDPWGNPKNVTIESVEVDGNPLSSTTKTEKTVTLSYEEGTYPVFINDLSKSEPDTADFTFSKLWRNASGKKAKSWPDDKDITVNILRAAGEEAPQMYASYSIQSTDITAIGTEISASGENTDLPKLIVIANTDNTYTFKLEGIPASNEEGERYTYYVAEPDVAGCQAPKYYSGGARLRNATMVGDNGVIANDNDAAVSVDIPVKKQLKGRDMKAGEFSFVMESISAEGIIRDEIDTIQNTEASAGVIAVSKFHLEYTMADYDKALKDVDDHAVFFYVISEKQGKASDILYDSQRYIAKVTLKLNDDTLGYDVDYYYYSEDEGLPPEATENLQQQAVRPVMVKASANGPIGLKNAK